MKFGILRERVNLSEQRVVFSPPVLLQMKQSFPALEVIVESSNSRVFTDEEYQNLGFEVANDISDCDVFFGINEVPIDALIENKTYFFFSNLLKNQFSGKQLLTALIEKNIDFYDYALFVNQNNHRLVSFDKYVGIVGAYNAIRAFGIKFELFKLPRANTLPGMEALISYLKRLVLPPLKFVVVGNEDLAKGVNEVLNAMKIKPLSAENYLSKNFTQSVYTQIDFLDSYKRIDEKVLKSEDFYHNHVAYSPDFNRLAEVSDVFIYAHSYGFDAPVILSRKILQAPNCKIKVVANISSDTNQLFDCTLRTSTLENPFYGYLAAENKEVDLFHPAAIVVMAVEDWSCELPKEASEYFGQMILNYIVPAFFNQDREGFLKSAKITENAKLTPIFAYLEDFVESK